MHHRSINSKSRVREHGEVFTHPREVNAMLDLVKQETERIDSRFFEPACGTGNFLAEVLRRKLEVVAHRYKKSRYEYDKHSLVAVSSIYGIDILKDSTEECRARLLDLYSKMYRKAVRAKPRKQILDNVSYILSKNIIWGDALTLREGHNSDLPVVFSEWNFAKGGMVKRRDFKLATLLENQPIEGLNLFSDLGHEAFIPKPVKEYPLVNYLSISKAYAD